MAKLTLIGTPFSTFTRTIALGLQKKGLAYDQVSTAPHSKTADEYHPLGYLPTLVIREEGSDDVLLRESAAIVRYIDRIVPTPSLHLQPGDGYFEEKQWEFASIIASYAYTRTEVTVIKIRVAKGDEGKLSDADIRASIAPAVAELRDFYKLVESLMAPSGFVFGKRVTWADYYLLPLLADLEATPEWEVINERLRGWLKEMNELPEVKATYPGTLKDGGRAPSD